MDNRIKLETSPNEMNNRYSAPLNYQGEEPPSRAGNGLNNRRSAPEFLTEK